MAAKLAITFIAALSVAILYQVPPKTAVPAGLVGTIAWWINDLAGHYEVNSTIIPVFIAGLWVGIASEWLARWMRSPATVFAVAGIVTLVPGTSAFQTMSAFTSGNSLEGIKRFTDTSLTAGAIAAGLVVAGSLARLGRKRLPK